MTTLGLDLASRTGWAIGTPSGILAFGHWEIAPRRGESPGMRYIRLMSYLREIRTAYPLLGFVAYEQAHARGGAATEYAAGCVATVQAFCAEHRIEHAAVHSSTLKKHATGSGRAEKGVMLQQARALVTGTVENDDQADAIHLAEYARTVLLHESPNPVKG